MDHANVPHAVRPSAEEDHDGEQGPADPRHPEVSHSDGQFMRRDLVEASPLTWLLEVDRMLVDVRRAPVHLQVQAFEFGLIPYVSGVGDDRP